jgi:HEAT repeat protein
MGYARQSRRQVDALVRASGDSSDDVRNDATRALGVLLESNPALAKWIPPQGFIDMMSSGIWTDRNKGGFVLEAMTRGRDPKLLGAVRAQALEPLIEMALARLRPRHLRQTDSGAHCRSSRSKGERNRRRTHPGTARLAACTLRPLTPKSRPITD